MLIRGLKQVFLEEYDHKDIWSRRYKTLESLDSFQGDSVLYKPLAGDPGL